MLSGALNLSGGQGVEAALLNMPRLNSGIELFVCNRSGAGGASINAGTIQQPLDTIANAVALCSASHGDVIYVMEGHAESLSTAGAIALATAGITIIGLGVGSNRPTLTWTATAATMTISAANVTFKNFIFDFTGIDAVVTAIVVSAANCKFYGCRFITAVAAAQATRCISAATADGFGVYDSVFDGSINTGTASAISITGDTLDPVGFEIYRNSFFGFYTTSAIEFLTTSPKNVRIMNNYFYSSATGVALWVTFVGAETGIAAYNVGKLVAGQGIQPFGSSAGSSLMSFAQNYCSDGGLENGALVVAAGTST